MSTPSINPLATSSQTLDPVKSHFSQYKDQKKNGNWETIVKSGLRALDHIKSSPKDTSTNATLNTAVTLCKLNKQIVIGRLKLDNPIFAENIKAISDNSSVLMKSTKPEFQKIGQYYQIYLLYLKAMQTVRLVRNTRNQDHAIALNNFEEKIEEAKKGIESFKDIDKHNTLLAKILLLEAQLHEIKSDNVQAIKVLLEVHAVFKSRNNPEILGFITLKLCELYYNEGDLLLARTYYLMAQEYVKDPSSLLLLKSLNAKMLIAESAENTDNQEKCTQKELQDKYIQLAVDEALAVIEEAKKANNIKIQEDMQEILLSCYRARVRIVYEVFDRALVKAQEKDHAGSYKLILQTLELIQTYEILKNKYHEGDNKISFDLQSKLMTEELEKQELEVKKILSNKYNDYLFHNSRNDQPLAYAALKDIEELSSLINTDSFICDTDGKEVIKLDQIVTLKKELETELDEEWEAVASK